MEPTHMPNDVDNQSRGEVDASPVVHQNDEPRYGISIKGQYKSIMNLEWHDIPPFAVVTGINGSGKSQLLEVIAKSRIQGVSNPRLSQFPTTIQYHEIQLAQHDIRLVQDPGDFTHSQSTSLMSFRQKLDNLIGGAATNAVGEEFRMLLQSLVGLKGISKEDALDQILVNYGVFLRNPNIVEGVTDIFMRYRTALFDAFERGIPLDELEQRVGPAPWNVLNDILAEANFPYRVPEPQPGLATTYKFWLIDQESNIKIDPVNLSSGERVILATVLWLFGSEHPHALPKLLLLDEPDAHLHPSLTRQFLDVIDGILVRKYGIRVILTTHSPSTVALAPKGSIFEMRRSETRIRPSASRWSTVGLLTNGLLTIGPDTKYVFTEDEGDVAFFQATQRVLQRPRPLADQDPVLCASPSLVFIPASQGRDSGGRTMVETWVTQIQGTHTHGIIDRDVENNSKDRLHLLGRYEVENYLADPIIVFAYLHGRQQAPESLKIDLAFGDEGTLRSRAPEQLQKIIDHILSALKPRLSAESCLPGTQDDSAIKVEVVDGPTLTYPRWFLENKGKRFLQAIRAQFGKQITWEDLRLTYERAGWVPVELLTILQTIQSS
jgi:hypothetical protein